MHDLGQNCIPVGMGVPVQQGQDSFGSAFESELNNITGIQESEKTKLKSPDKYEWSAEPFLKGQFQTRELWEYDRILVKLYDLSKSEELEEYSAVIQDSFAEDPRIVVLDEQKQFCQNAENWKVLIQFAKIKYKKFIDEEGN